MGGGKWGAMTKSALIAQSFPMALLYFPYLGEQAVQSKRGQRRIQGSTAHLVEDLHGGALQSFEIVAAFENGRAASLRMVASDS